MSNTKNGTKRRRICLFGLSADPPTGEGGHVGIAKALATLRSEDDNDEKWAFDEVRVLPVYRHTFSDKRQRLVSFEHRLQMCQAAFAGIPRVTVSNDEYHSWCHAVKDVPPAERAKVSVGTAALLDYYYNGNSSQHEHQKAQTNDADFYFCLGADAFLDLTAGKWKESALVLELLQGRLIVLNRKVDAKDVVDDSLLRQRVQATPGARIVRMDHLENVSSSQVRACRDPEQLKELVAPAVLDYMQQQKLYQFAKEDQDSSQN